MADRKKLIRVLSFAAYFVVAFLIFCFVLFPFDRVKTKLESEVSRRTPVELTIGHISPRFFNRFVLQDVVVSDKTGRVLFESPAVRTTVSLLSLLRGSLALDLDARAYNGDLLVKLIQEKGGNSYLVDAADLDIGSYALLKSAGLSLSGTIGGHVEMTGDVGRARIWAKDLASRDLKVKGFAIPDLDFSRGWLEADLKGDRLTVKKLELDGKQLKVRCLGDLVLNPHGTLNLTVKLKPSDQLAAEQSVIFSLLKNRNAEGYYQFSLGGTVEAPMPRL